jgi:hypothetical protein
MFVVARGEVEVVLGHTSYVPILTEGAFVCEASLLDVARCGDARNLDEIGYSTGSSPLVPSRRTRDPIWMFRGWSKLPRGILGMVAQFLVKGADGPRFRGKLRTTRRSLIGELTRWALVAILQKHGSDATNGLLQLPATFNALQNVAAFGAEAQEVNANDIARRIVCDGPMQVSCQSAVRNVRQGLFGGCMQPSVISD